MDFFANGIIQKMTVTGKKEEIENIINKMPSTPIPNYAFKNNKIFSFAGTVGDTGGLLYFELAPNRPDLVLKDLIHIFHPEMMPEYTPVFFKPLE